MLFRSILKTGNRLGDNAKMCFIELVDYNENMLKEKATKKTTRTRRSKKKETTPLVEAAAAVEATPATPEAPTAEVPAAEKNSAE